MRAWLLVIAGLVYPMILVGGATRLTDSGLSITEWKPLLGAFPPMNDADWADAFAKYQSMTAQYHLLNPGMDIAGFKGIYWWEWSHRELGRVIGVAFALPLIFFWATGRTTKKLLPHLARAVRAGRAAGADRLVDGVVGRELRADVGRALSADDALLPGAGDHLLTVSGCGSSLGPGSARRRARRLAGRRR